MNRAAFALSLIGLLFSVSCQKKDNNRSSISTFPSGNASILNSSLSYGDTIFYTSGINTNRLIYPVTRPLQPGSFTASLPGLDLDPVSGRINVSRSETGLRYEVYFVSGTAIIDSTSVTLSGVDYQDNIYNISSSESQDILAVPIYNMSPDLPLPCDTAPAEIAACVFDETDLNGDGIRDISGATRAKLVIDKKTGIINLKESFVSGLFGSTPVNGRRKDVSIYYRLNDGSSRTLNRITIRLVYYQSRAMIPESMVMEINSRNERYLQIGDSETAISELLSYSYTTLKPKRPPLIVIVSGL